MNTFTNTDGKYCRKCLVSHIGSYAMILTDLSSDTSVEI